MDESWNTTKDNDLAQRLKSAAVLPTTTFRVENIKCRLLVWIFSKVKDTSLIVILSQFDIFFIVLPVRDITLFSINNFHSDKK